MEQTKGYLKLKGVIWSLNNKKALESDTKKSLSFGLKTSKDNSLFLQVGEWKNTKLNVKIKGEGETEVSEVNEQVAIDKIKTTFKDGDSVFVNLRADVDTYRKKINFLVNQIYIENEPINFESADFEETNELNQTVVIIDKPSNRKVSVGLTTYRGEMIEQELTLSDDDINSHFVENAKAGDLMKLTISVNRKPNYIDSVEDAPVRKTLKGKSVSTGGKRAIDKDNPSIESLEVLDVDVEKTEKSKYNKKEIREAIELAEVKAAKPAKEEVVDTIISEEEFPF